MRSFLTSLLIVALGASIAGCHPGPLLGRTSQSVGGTIAGLVSATGGTVPLSARRVTAINVDTGMRYDATTNVTGGYTIKVPEGTYRIEVELRQNETVSKQPDPTHVNNGDLDPARNFEITVR
jgi:hypothetical protein